MRPRGDDTPATQRSPAGLHARLSRRPSAPVSGRLACHRLASVLGAVGTLMGLNVRSYRGATPKRPDRNTTRAGQLRLNKITFIQSASLQVIRDTMITRQGDLMPEFSRNV
jgi:hypothetical protein